jgi:hypothetical protein
MNSNLKFSYDIANDINALREHLLQFSAYSKISALSVINSNQIEELLDQVKICAYDFRAHVRIYAYKALALANPESITEVLRDALRDEDSDAFKAARELFTTMKIKK